MSEAKSAPTTSDALEQLRGILSSRGARGIIGLGRCFRVHDSDGNGSFSLPEFKNAVKAFGLELSRSEMTALFKHFDVDRSGDISFNEFLSGIKVLI